MRAEIVDADCADWTSFACSHPSASFFHTGVWSSVIADCYGLHRLVVLVRDQAGRVAAGLPVVEARSPLGRRRWVSLPFTDACPPLLAPGAAPLEVLDALGEASASAGVRALEIRGEIATSPGVHLVARGVEHSTRLEPGAGSLAGRISKRHMRNVRTAEKNGVAVHRGMGRSDIDEFYRLHVMTRHRLGVPVQPRRYFDMLAARAFPDSGFVMSAVANGSVVASVIFLLSPHALVYKYSASDPTASGLRATHLLCYEALTWASEQGLSALDWGRSDLEAEGLRAFKAGWAAEERPLVYTYVADKPPRQSSGRVYAATRVVLRHSPAWVCRAAGAAVYRFAA